MAAEIATGHDRVGAGIPSHVPVGGRPLEIAVVGLGARGLAVLERLLAVARSGRARPGPISIHVIEPQPPGAGVYGLDQPGYWLMNTPCGQISLYPGGQSGPRLPYQRSLLEWVGANRYGWHGNRCDTEPGGSPISEHDFLPREVVGRYLRWFYETLLECVPAHVVITHHPDEVIDVVRTASGRERLSLRSGASLEQDFVVLTTGHTSNLGQGFDGSGMVSPDAARSDPGACPPGSTVAVCGMGLVANDVVSLLTVGRGGQYQRSEGRLRYLPSGREPQIRLFSRSGLPYCAKAVGMPNLTTSYQPGIWMDPSPVTPGGPRHPLNWDRDLLPQLLGEMTLQYYTQASLLQDGPQASEQLRRDLIEAWQSGSFADQVRSLAGRLGRFDPQEHLFPDLGPGLGSGASYHHFVRGALEADLAEAESPGGSSPTKMAYEVLRFLRTRIRRAVEFGGLDGESHLAFFGTMSGRIARLVAGPPASRSRELLALMDAGIVSYPYGPSPEVEVKGSGEAWIASTHLERSCSERVDAVVRGYMELPVVHRSASPLLASLYSRGRVSPLRHEGQFLGGLEMTPDGHPVNRSGDVERSLWVFGAVTEGARYFTNCIPSPGSRIWSFEDALQCALEILDPARRLAASEI